jgi:hypothetical protein
MAFDPSAPLVRSPDIIASEVDGELVLISIEDGKYFGLDTVGSEIWRLLEAPQSTNALVEALKAQFEGDADDVERDTLAFIDELATHALVRAA